LIETDIIGLITGLIGQPLKTPARYIEAFTHGSYSSKDSKADYQRLEFLGDRVLGIVIADVLCERFPNDPEGQLSTKLNALVSRECCADVARSLNIAPLILMGKQARDDGGRESDNILGDVMEALLGAIYLDFGLEFAKTCVEKYWDDRICTAQTAAKHPKSALQEWSAAHNRRPPEYEVLQRDGPPHAPRFTVLARIPKLAEAQATGASKQEAEKSAATALLRKVSI
jgi:ribonuclease III